MNPIDYIVSWCNSISTFFYSIYQVVIGWVYPFWEAAGFFYQLSLLFNSMAWDFYYFSLWVEDVKIKIADVLSFSSIYTYFKTYFDAAVNAWNWIIDAWWNVTNIINNWWASTQYTVLTWISDAESYSLSLYMSLMNWVTGLISDVEIWTLAQIESVKAALLVIISDIELWTITEFNVVRDWVIVLLSDIEAWTTTQLQTLKTYLLAVITDIEAWTIAEFNNIKEMIGAAMPWDEILARIISWGAIPGTAVQGLIDSTLRAWFPFYDDLVSLWNSIVDFFVDPEDWLYKAVDRIIERFW